MADEPVIDATRARWGETLAEYLLTAGYGELPYREGGHPSAGRVSQAARNLALDALAQAIPAAGLQELSPAEALRVSEVAAAVSVAAVLEYRAPS